MRLITSEKAKRPRLRALLWETANIARELGVDPTDLEVRVYGAPPGKRSFGVFQYVKLVNGSRWAVEESLRPDPPAATTRRLRP